MTMDDLDKKAQEDLRFLKGRMTEWDTNDYIDDESLEKISHKSFELAGELMQSAPELWSKLNEYDVTAPGQKVSDVETLYGHAVHDNEVGFMDFIEKKTSTWNEAKADPSVQIEAPAVAPDEADREVDHTAKAFEQEAAEAPVESRTSSRNLIRIEDPDDLLMRQTSGTLKPHGIREEFLQPGMIRDDNPGQFLSKPSYLQISSVKNVETFLNKYRLLRNRADLVWTEGDLLSEFCDDGIMKYVVEKISLHRKPESLTFVFFVENPLFVYCVFGRRKDQERYKLKKGESQVPPNKRKYSWAGHRYCQGVDSRDLPPEQQKDRKPLPPSTFQFKPPAPVLYNNSKPASAKQAAATPSVQDGWE